MKNKKEQAINRLRSLIGFLDEMGAIQGKAQARKKLCSLRDFLELHKVEDLLIKQIVNECENDYTFINNRYARMQARREEARENASTNVNSGLYRKE